MGVLPGTHANGFSEYVPVDVEKNIFGSEIKALLQHPAIDREVDLTGLDQVFCFPGLVSPRTMFKGIESLPNGHYLLVKNGNVKITQYWDLDYPQAGDIVRDKPESYYVEKLKYLFAQSVKYRLQADVPVGFYLSGGLDSSMIASMIRNVSPGITRHSFSIGFNQTDICEARYQRMMSEYSESAHHEIMFDWKEIAERLPRMIYHSECPVKETYNTCSMALSEAAKASGITVILTGEGADELFAGYVGYRFDQFGLRAEKKNDLQSMLEDELREKLWGDATLFSYGGKRANFSHVPAEHWRFLETQLVAYLETKTHLFVHANVSPDVPMRNQTDHMLRWERCDESRQHFSKKVIVCGHTPQKSRRPLVRDHLICIDTAAFHDGYLTALDVSTGTVWQAPGEGPVEMSPLADFPRRK